MSFRHSNRALLLAGLTLYATAVEARSSWKLRVQPKRGSEQSYVVSTDVTMNADLGLLGRSKGSTRLRVELDQRVVKRERRGPTTLELTYRRIQLDFELGERRLHFDSAEPEGREEGARQQIGRLVGRAVTLEVSRLGEILEVGGLEDLWEGVDEGTERDPLLEALTRGLGTEMLRGLFQQASPLLPEKKVRAGDGWGAAFLLPDPAFGELSIASNYEIQGAERKGTRKSVRLGVANVIEIDGRGPLLDQLGSIVGTRGEVRARTKSAGGGGTLWIDRKSGLTNGMEMTQQLSLELSAPVRLLGFKKTVRVPVQIDQEISIERVKPRP